MSRPLVVHWQDSAETLQERYLQEAHGPTRTRLHALWLVRTGRPLKEVAAVLGVTSRALQNWVQWYREGGLLELQRHPLGGRRTPTQACRLSPAQQEALRQWTREGRCFRVADAQEWVQQQYGVSYSYWGMWELLHRLGLRPKRPRPQHKRADPRAQAAWREGAPEGAGGARDPAHRPGTLCR